MEWFKFAACEVGEYMIAVGLANEPVFVFVKVVSVFPMVVAVAGCAG